MEKSGNGGIIISAAGSLYIRKTACFRGLNIPADGGNHMKETAAALPMILLAGDLLLSLWGFLLCRFDKRRAVKGGRRIRERTFFLLSLFGGGPGVWAGMYAFRHKTLHRSFRFGIPALILLAAGWQIALTCLIH